MKAVIEVFPPEYYPLIEKLFISRLIPALDVFGMEVQNVRVDVFPEDGTVTLDFFLVIGFRDSVSQLKERELVESVLEKLAQDATEGFGSFYSVNFKVRTVETVTVRISREKKRAEVVVNAPEEWEEQMERIGKGVSIYLEEKGVDVNTVVISLRSRERLLNVLIKVSERIPQENLEELGTVLRSKILSSLSLMKLPPLGVRVEFLTPEKSSIGKLIESEIRLEKIAEEIIQNEEIKRLMELLGKKPL